MVNMELWKAAIDKACRVRDEWEAAEKIFRAEYQEAAYLREQEARAKVDVIWEEYTATAKERGETP